MKNQHQSEKHLFALHHADLSDEIAGARIGAEISIADSDLTHRIVSILRVEVGESLILFDRNMHAIVSLLSSVKNKLVKVTLQEKNKNSFYSPEIIFLLPVLKKESLETALYSLAEMGVTKIQLVHTQKSQQRWEPREMERAQKIIIAAAEQSKNFGYPQLIAAKPLSAVIKQLSSESNKLFFDPAGSCLDKQLDQLKANSNSIILAIGPEGDLTGEEKELLKKADFSFTALTPTILRASQAAAVAAGIIRSYLR